MFKSNLTPHSLSHLSALMPYNFGVRYFAWRLRLALQRLRQYCKLCSLLHHYIATDTKLGRPSISCPPFNFSTSLPNVDWGSRRLFNTVRLVCYWHRSKYGDLSTYRAENEVALTPDRFRIPRRRLAIGHGMSVAAKAFSTEPVTINWLGTTVTSCCCSAGFNTTR